jgi:hypothetical protein
MTGVALPLIVKDFGLSPVDRGIVSAASLAGIMVGAIALGGLADTYGRRRMFVVEMIVFALFLAGLTWSPNYLWLVVFLFGVGLALGCDYPTAHLVISDEHRQQGPRQAGAERLRLPGDRASSSCRTCPRSGRGAGCTVAVSPLSSSPVKRGRIEEGQALGRAVGHFRS